MGKKGVYGKGPVDVSRHQELADDAARKAAAERNPDRKHSLENLRGQHQREVDIELVRRRVKGGK